MANVERIIPCGEIVGLDMGEYDEFRGIKYANAKRWEYPVEITEFDGKYDATKFGANSYQRRGFEEDEVCNAFYHKEFRKGMTFEYSEDCQFLNIYVPKNANNCPVFVYIHGGSFTGGSSNEGHINGSEYAKNGVIFVSINYRLNVFGFCSHPDIEQNGICGNFGLFDQVAALSWIRNNISAFGGDVNRITIAGQSAGAMSVDMLVSSPLCKGWFAGAIMMSGPGLERLVARPLSPEKTRKFWDMIIQNANCKNIDELKQVDERTLFYAWSDACKADGVMSNYHTLPVVDGKLVTKETFNKNTIPDIPYIFGMTCTDMFPIILQKIVTSYAKKASKNTSKSYTYSFNRNLPGDNNGAWHSCDLLYAFKTLDFNWRPFEDIDYKVSNELFSAFCNFAKTGDPNCDALPQWTTDYNTPMTFGADSKCMPWDKNLLFKNTFSNQGAEF